MDASGSDCTKLRGSRKLLEKLTSFVSLVFEGHVSEELYQFIGSHYTTKPRFLKGYMLDFHRRIKRDLHLSMLDLRSVFNGKGSHLGDNQYDKLFRRFETWFQVEPRLPSSKHRCDNMGVKAVVSGPFSSGIVTPTTTSVTTTLTTSALLGTSRQETTSVTFATSTLMVSTPTAVASSSTSVMHDVVNSNYIKHINIQQPDTPNFELRFSDIDDDNSIPFRRKLPADQSDFNTGEDEETDTDTTNNRQQMKRKRTPSKKTVELREEDTTVTRPLEYREKKPEKPPPIFLDNNLTKEEMNNLERGSDTLTFRSSRQGTSVFTKKMKDYDRVKQHLFEKKQTFFTYKKKEERSKQFLIHGIPTWMDESEIVYYLSQQGYSDVEQITRLKRKGEDQQLINTETIRITIPPGDEQKTIFNLKRIGRHELRVVPLPPKEGPAFCKHCGAWGHSDSACYRKQICFKCGEAHSARGCTIYVETRKCINCNGPHFASSIECTHYKEALFKWQQRRSVSRQQAEASRTPRKFAPAPTTNVWDLRRQRIQEERNTPLRVANDKTASKSTAAVEQVEQYQQMGTNDDVMNRLKHKLPRILDRLIAALIPKATGDMLYTVFLIALEEIRDLVSGEYL